MKLFYEQLHNKYALVRKGTGYPSKRPHGRMNVLGHFTVADLGGWLRGL